MKLINTKTHISGLLALIFTIASGTAWARPSVEVTFGGDAAIPSGVTGVLVADRSGNGFQSLAHTSVVGTTLEAGQTIGFSDDLIIGTFVSSSAAFDSGNGFSGLLTNIPYHAWQLAPGTALKMYWFPGISTAGTMLSASDAYSGFELSVTLPAARGLYSIAELTTANGGNADIAAGTSSGNVGDDDSNQGGNTHIDIPGTPFEDVTLTPVGYSDDQRGKFLGLVVGADGRINGEARGSLSSRGVASFTIYINRSSYRVRGTFDTQTGALGPVDYRDGTFNLQLNESTSGETFIAGTAAIGTENYTIVSIRQAPGGEIDLDKIPGRYTIVLPGDNEANSTINPAGNGIGFATVSKSGVIKASFTLGDGSRTSDSTYLGEGGSWQLYSAIPGGGLLAGELQFRSEDNISDIDGPLRWKKEANDRAKTYPLGFDLSVYAVGSKYRKPWPGERVLSQISNTDPNVQWEGVADGATVTESLNWASNNRIARVKTDTRSLTHYVRTSTGYIYGNLIEGGKKFYFRGAALQKQGTVAGVIYSADPVTEAFSIQPLGTPVLEVTDGSDAVLSDGDTIDFGDVGITGGTSVRIIKLSNTGTGNLYIDKKPEPSDPAYSVATGRNGWLMPGESTALRVRAEPGAEGAVTASIVINSNDADNNPFSLNLSANGVAGGGSDIESGTALSMIAVPADFTPESYSDAAFSADADKGRYGGSIFSGDGGYASLLISASGKFSGRITIGSKSATVRGSFSLDDPDVGATITYFKGALTADHSIISIKTVGIPLDPNAVDGDPLPPGAVSLVLATPTGEETVILHHQNFTSKSPTDKAGRYTVVIPNTEAAGDGYPAGDGIATMSISAAGTIRASFKLADRRTVTASGRLASDNSWDFYRRLRTGVLTGELYAVETAEADLQGDVVYQRNANPKSKLFPYGFTMDSKIVGSLYTAPASGSSAMVLADQEGNALLNLTGNLTTQVNNLPLTWSVKDRVKVQTPAEGERFSIVVSRKSGRVSGRSNVNREKTSFTGVIYQKQNQVTGNWGTTTEAGHFSIVPTR